MLHAYIYVHVWLGVCVYMSMFSCFFYLFFTIQKIYFVPFFIQMNRKMIHDTFYKLRTMTKILVDFNIIGNRIILKIGRFIG